MVLLLVVLTAPVARAEPAKVSQFGGMSVGVQWAGTNTGVFQSLGFVSTSVHGEYDFNDSVRFSYDRRVASWLTAGLDLSQGSSLIDSCSFGDFGGGCSIVGSTFTVGLSPRLGALLPIFDWLAVWPRVGASLLVTQKTIYPDLASLAQKPSETIFRLPLDADVQVLFLTPLNHLSVAFGIDFKGVLISSAGPNLWHMTGGFGLLTYW